MGRGLIVVEVPQFNFKVHQARSMGRFKLKVEAELMPKLMDLELVA